MKSHGFILALVLTAFSTSFIYANDGEKLFKSNCASCHMLGRKLVGPNLIGVHERRSEEWLLKFIKSSQTMVKSGDSTAVRLFKEFNNIPMPDAFINEDEIKAVLSYIKIKGDEMLAGGGQKTVANGATTAAEVTPATTTQSSIDLLNMFSFTEYLLIGLIILFLIIIWMLTRTIKSLSSQLSERFNE